MTPNCIWRKSTRSDSNAGQCVEVGPLTDASGRVAVRDSKHREGPAFVTSKDEWSGFIAGLRDGDYSL